MNNIQFLLLLSLIITLAKVTCADNAEQFYLITVKDTTPKSHHKRQEVSSSVEATIDEIHNLIVENKDTFVNPEKLDELDEGDSQLKKRNIKYLMDYGSSNYVYQIATLEEGKSILYGYLNEKIVKFVMKLPNVISCNPDRTYKPATYDRSEILNETKWKDLEVSNATSSHLSLISQGIYDKSYFKYYDSKYYYPKKGGKGVDIYIFDTGFNFNHTEFSNTNEREVKCYFNVVKGKVIESTNEKYCFFESHTDNHGTLCATAAAGKTFGSAPQANIYGILINSYSSSNIVSGINFIIKNFMDSRKPIINFSFANIYDPAKLSSNDIEEYNLIDEFNKKGGLVFAGAGNYNMNVYDKELGRAVYPCVYNNTICVGGVANKKHNDLEDYSYFSNYESFPYSRSIMSNYGSEVDLYAPFFFYLSYKNSTNDKISREIIGTSLSSPLTAGVVATFISDNPDIKFTKESILELLQKLAHKNVIAKAPTPNYFLNNGKKSIYLNSHDDRCGVNFGNKKCKNNLCCSADGYCGELYQHCFENCQQGFGICYN